MEEVLDKHGGVKTRWDFATRFTTFFRLHSRYTTCWENPTLFCIIIWMLHLWQCIFCKKKKLNEWVIFVDEVYEMKFINKHKFNFTRHLWIMEIDWISFWYSSISRSIFKIKTMEADRKKMIKTLFWYKRLKHGNFHSLTICPN